MNKPIAWTTDELNTDNWGDTDWQITVTKEKWSDKQKPLYIHQADLTDEEIEECFAESCTDFKLLENGKTKGVVNIIDVGRAILRKAQEK